MEQLDLNFYTLDDALVYFKRNKPQIRTREHIFSLFDRKQLVLSLVVEKAHLTYATPDKVHKFIVRDELLEIVELTYYEKKLADIVNAKEENRFVLTVNYQGQECQISNVYSKEIQQKEKFGSIDSYDPSIFPKGGAGAFYSNSIVITKANLKKFLNNRPSIEIRDGVSFYSFEAITEKIAEHEYLSAKSAFDHIGFDDKNTSNLCDKRMAILTQQAHWKDKVMEAIQSEALTQYTVLGGKLRSGVFIEDGILREDDVNEWLKKDEEGLRRTFQLKHAQIVTPKTLGIIDKEKYSIEKAVEIFSNNKNIEIKHTKEDVYEAASEGKLKICFNPQWGTNKHREFCFIETTGDIDTLQNPIREYERFIVPKNRKPNFITNVFNLDTDEDVFPVLHDAGVYRLVNNFTKQFNVPVRRGIDAINSKGETFKVYGCYEKNVLKDTEFANKNFTKWVKDNDIPASKSGLGKDYNSYYYQWLNQQGDNPDLLTISVDELYLTQFELIKYIESIVEIKPTPKRTPPPPSGGSIEHLQAPEEKPKPTQEQNNSYETLTPEQKAKIKVIIQAHENLGIKVKKKDIYNECRRINPDVINEKFESFESNTWITLNKSGRNPKFNSPPHKTKINKSNKL